MGMESKMLQKVLVLRWPSKSLAIWPSKGLAMGIYTMIWQENKQSMGTMLLLRIIWHYFLDAYYSVVDGYPSAKTMVAAFVNSSANG